MILCANEEFYKLGKDEINKICSVIKKEMPEIAHWQLKNSYIVDTNRIILCYSTMDEDHNLISYDIKIEYNDGKRVYAKSTKDELELVSTDITSNTVYKYVVKLDNGNIISSRSILVGTDILTLTRNLTENTVELDGDLSKFDINSNIEEFDDDLDYLIHCMNNNSNCRIRKNIG